MKCQKAREWCLQSFEGKAEKGKAVPCTVDYAYPPPLLLRKHGSSVMDYISQPPLTAAAWRCDQLLTNGI